MTAYYNEIDPYAAQWLRNLIAKGHIAAGDVDERSIEDVRPDDLRGYTQCHFFAGIGVWSRALRLAGWADDRPVWTGSCPCQPFSQAGKGSGFADERHLWPAWDWLISERRPPIILGEQVASKDIDPWIDLVQADLEAMGYALGCVPFPSAGVGAPHIRDRAYFMAHTYHARSQGRRRVRERPIELFVRTSGMAVELADAGGERRRGERLRVQPRQPRQGDIETRWSGQAGIVADGGACGQGRAIYGGRNSRGDALTWSRSGSSGLFSLVANTDGRHACAEGVQRSWQYGQQPEDSRIERIEPAGPTNGFWRDADWLSCRDEKWRPVEPGTFPLADGAPARVGRLRAYGNAINAEAAAEFIRAAREAIEQ